MLQRYVSEEFVMVRRRRIRWSAIASDVLNTIHDRVYSPAQRAVNCVRKHAHAIGAAACIGVMAAISAYQSLVG